MNKFTKQYQYLNKRATELLEIAQIEDTDEAWRNATDAEQIVAFFAYEHEDEIEWE